MARGAKRTLDEIAIKSDSEDEDYSDHGRSARSTGRKTTGRKTTGKKSKAGSRKNSRRGPKRRRRDSDDGITSDGEESSEVSEDLEFDEMEEDSDDVQVERNVRGTARRRTTQSRPPLYQEPDSEEDLVNDDSEDAHGEDEHGEDEPGAPSPPKSTIIKLKLPPRYLAHTKRVTRHTRDGSEDIFALTNSGRHVQTIEQGTRSPDMEISTHHVTRVGRKATRTIIEDEDEDEVINETTIQGSQMEILESDVLQGGADGDTLPVNDGDNHPIDQEMLDEEHVVPESENGDDKNVQTEEPGKPSTTHRPDRLFQEQFIDQVIANAESQPRRSSRKQLLRGSQRKSKDEESDFEPEEEVSNDEEEDSEPEARAPSRKDSQAHEEAEDSSASRRPGLRQRRALTRAPTEEAEELAEELEDLTSGRLRRRAKQTTVVYEKPRRNRKDVDYRIIRPEILQPSESSDGEVAASPSRRGRGGGGWQRTWFSTEGPFGGTGNTAILGGSGGPTAAGGVDSDSSDDDGGQQPNRTGLVATHNHPGDPAQASSGAPANLGKITNSKSLSDIDPLGVDMNINFDQVGGLQGHIDQLKEMVSLPLLYPEIFQRFKITPPRGVLFHGPPGTGKTLMARALSNSVSSEGRRVTFYMRKGADVMSKWVGEAERQLRLLFEEARKNQPSIIFFDEIDGLAPVRSSKQEQIHSSIVSTLLALMDGMEGRGQVVVIGATNRPDSVDPALRRPGRFDREFYFSLPNLEARRAILDIHTKEWNPPLPSNVKDELAAMTKGYGGADLRALCTEAAINAVQRRYPQIYKSDQKLVIDPKTIDVVPKDFMIAIKKIVPSSERFSSSGATALPPNIEPLLRQPLSEIKSLLSEILPQRKKLTALEEAQYEEVNDGNGFSRELMLQEFDRSRVFRPRLLLRGPHGMGQQYLAAALLHVFEGLHVQAFDLPTLLSDSGRSVEAAVIQLFTEVRRHKPSVIYIPNIHLWVQTVGPAVISTFMGLLRSLPPSDPVLLLGILESSEEDVDTNLLKHMFGFSKRNLYDLSAPDHNARHEFFGKIVEFVKTPPKHFPEPENRKLRQLEELEVAPPPPAKPEPELTQEDLKAQKRKDNYTLNLLKIRIQPVMDQLKRYKRFKSGVIDESQIRYLLDEADPNIVTTDLPHDPENAYRPYEKAYDKRGVAGLRETATGKFFYNLDLVTIEKRLSNGYYKRPEDFVADIKRLAKDARQTGDPERILRSKELVANVEVDMTNITTAEPALVAECERVYQRELAREKAAAERRERDLANTATATSTESDQKAHGNTELGPSLGPVHPVLVPTNGDDEKALSRPVTPANKSNSTFGNEDPSRVADAATGSHGDGDGDVFMSNSDDHSGSKDTQGSSFGPSAQPKPPYSHTAPSQQIRRESGLSSFSQRGPMTPMAPGSQPADYVNEASTTQTTSEKVTSENLSNQTYHTQSPHVSRIDYPDLTQYPDRVSQEDQLPDTQQGDSSQPSPRPRDSLLSNVDTQENSDLIESQSQSKPQPPLFHEPSMPAADASNKPQPMPNEEAHEPLILDLEVVERLHTQLTLSTSGFSVEQLEQINTSLMDYVWQKRGEWNRTHVADGLGKTYNAVLEDMQEMQEIGPISQQTKDILANLSFQ
ncbi:uncharacterized protein N7515_009183 [Penicillium bovifimosum]|uniref:Bromo domain-containing protein n=1 Tax=Penicillium bovifimosum TaxID=126998 RepID=A0A9W9KV97_9EURO|nr:uncharacterized protein N7515_009183 [Penicillium bovifimosum]KAJ5121222.1 hypothetical protein N7515_009183 [Penicillium bovifimosum]